MWSTGRLLLTVAIAAISVQITQGQANDMLFCGGPAAAKATSDVATNAEESADVTFLRPKTKVAKAAAETLDQNIDLGAIDSSLGQLDVVLSKATKQPFFIDQRAIALAELDNETVIRGPAGEWPLRSSLRRLLRPHGLKVAVEDEGLVVTADFAELTRRGIATDYWISSNPEGNDEIVRALNQKLTVGFNNLQLDTAIAELSEQTGIEIIIDHRALEEIGLTRDTPVHIRLNDTSLRTILRLMLRELDLTYRIHDELMEITTIEASEQNLANRVYFMEGTGAITGDLDGIIQIVQTTIVPDTWEALGGPSTIASMAHGDGNRPAIIVSVTSDVHEQIADLFRAMRKNHVGPDPGFHPAKSAKSMSPPKVVGGGGGGMGGGGGGFM